MILIHQCFASFTRLPVFKVSHLPHPEEMKVSETPSLTEFGFFPGSLPLDPSDARARRKFIKGFTE